MTGSEEQRQPQTEAWTPLAFHAGQYVSVKQARAWALVLDARSIPCMIEATAEGYRLLVPPGNLESARSEIRLYEEQNRHWPPSIPAPRALSQNALPTLSILLLLATFHNLTQIEITLPGGKTLDLYELGIGRSAAIRNGEWWRAVTALTLHADVTHLLGNLAIGGVIIIPLCRELGSGLAWSLLLLAGTLGNLANAWIQSPDHRSLGSSTAIFAAIGIFTATSMLRWKRRPPGKPLTPLAAGLALLALLGSEGKQTDLGAHLFGFVTGLVIGLATGLPLGEDARPGPTVNVMLGLAAALAVVLAWWAALFPLTG